MTLNLFFKDKTRPAIYELVKLIDSGISKKEAAKKVATKYVVAYRTTCNNSRIEGFLGLKEKSKVSSEHKIENVNLACGKFEGFMFQAAKEYSNALEWSLEKGIQNSIIGKMHSPHDLKEYLDDGSTTVYANSEVGQSLSKMELNMYYGSSLGSSEEEETIFKKDMQGNFILGLENEKDRIFALMPSSLEEGNKDLHGERKHGRPIGLKKIRTA
ncbi:hypothetical protein HOD29_00210 [archaeon]|jgi:hypothetical protein|nr:hypothetical protein [archaeon]